MTKLGRFFACALGVVGFGTAAFGDTIQSVTLPFNPAIQLIAGPPAPSPMHITYTGVDTGAHTGNLSITGTEKLINMGSGPTVNISNVAFTLTATINWGTAGSYFVLPGATLTLINGGTDINAAISPVSNFGFDLVSGGGALLNFVFIESTSNAGSALASAGVLLNPGAALGVTIDITGDKAYAPTLASFGTNGGLDYSGNLAKADISTPLPKSVWGAGVLLLGLGASLRLRRPVASLV